MSTVDPLPGESTGPAPEQEAGRKVDSKQILRRYLLHTREVPNGKDFLFSGPPDVLLDTLRTLVIEEHARQRGLRLDFAAIGAIFLLRVTGGPEEQGEIGRYLEPA